MNSKTLLNTGSILTLIVAFCFGSFQTFAQSSEEEIEKRVKVKVITSEEGETEEVQEIIIEGDDFQKEIIIEGEDGEKIVKVIKLDDLDEQIEVKVESILEEVLGDDEIQKQIRIAKSMHGEDHEIHINHNGANAMFFGDEFPEKFKMKFKGDFGPNKALLGVYGTSLTDEDKAKNNVNYGVKITGIVEESAAEAAGLQKDDILVKINEMTVISFNNLTEVMGMFKPKDKATVTFVRDGQEMTKEVEFGENTQQNYFEFSDKAFDKMSWVNMDSDDERAFLGVIGGEPNDEVEGAPIEKVLDESAAKEMGIEAGDFITKINGEDIGSFSDLGPVLKELKPGDDVDVEVNRDGKTKKMSGTLKSKAETKGVEENVFMYKIKDCEDGRPGKKKEIRIAVLIDDMSGEEKEELEKNAGVKVDNDDLQLNDFMFLPNPTTGVFKVSFEPVEEGDIELQLFDQAGKEIMNDVINTNGEKVDMELDISEEATGIYFLIVSQNGKSSSKKIVKK